ncbi:peptide ABC transporter substrate-binding protein [Vagococcus sp. BWB3-3]|uniref:Peptide ABC transporter substrate-binding protein n=1 Tax=Vagococcus allomyrinae TaxID=2794353 RepID=A0A940STL7_9ENTE|nr:peptide ABC transporter substrate-binding protein [Vagococcus allomyrinae]MBP1040425.1 peptide ABC transporter substrate-binding protein [Vagococcus allomyrinae]
MKKLLKASLLMIVGATLLGACGSKGADTSKNDTTKETKELNLMSATELTTLDTSVMLDFPDAIVQTAAFEGLYGLDKDDAIIPAAAKELPDISEDGKTYTIKLRENGKWTNGDSVTADDFVYAWKKMIDPDNALVYSFLIQDTILNGVEIAAGDKPVDELGVKALDDYTLEIKLKEARPYFTSLMAFPTFFPQNQTYVEEKGKAYGTDTDNTIYNGPFVVKNWKQSDLNWDLEKNEDYWDKDNVKSDTIHYEVVKESSTALNLYESGELDVAVLTGVLASENKDNPDFQSNPTATINYLRLNQERNGKKTPLANENLRKAIAYGIDKETIINNIVADGSEPTYGLIPNGFLANPETGKDFREEAGDLMNFDEAEALSYWKKAQAELGQKVTVDLLVNDDGNYKKIAESIQGGLEQLFEGLTIDVRSMPTETALNLGRESDYEMFLIYWTPDYQDPISTLNTFHSENKMHYSNPTYDDLLDKAATSLANKPGERWQALMDAEKEIIQNTAGTIAISQNKQSVLQNPALEGLEYHTFAAPVTLKSVYKK